MLDIKEATTGLGRLRAGPGYDRLVGRDGKTVAYLKKNRVTVPAARVAKAPKRLGAFKVEKNGRWTGVAVTDTAKARAILEYVAQKASV